MATRPDHDGALVAADSREARAAASWRVGQDARSCQDAGRREPWIDALAIGEATAAATMRPPPDVVADGGLCRHCRRRDPRGVGVVTVARDLRVEI